MHRYRTHSCDDLRPEHVGEEARLSGWVHRIARSWKSVVPGPARPLRNYPVRRRYRGRRTSTAVEAVRPESVVTVTGKVVKRSADTINPEPRHRRGRTVGIDDFNVPSMAAMLPLQVHGESGISRRKPVCATATLICAGKKCIANIMLRSAIIASIRRRMIEQGFTEFQTPILTASSPEGARDFLVPSRLHPGEFYALPQAPQHIQATGHGIGLRSLFSDRPVLSRRGRPRRPGAGRVLSARCGDVLRRARRCLRRPGAGFRRCCSSEFSDHAGDRPDVSAHRLRRGHAKIWHRQAGSAQPARSMCDVTDAFAGSGASSIFASMIAGDDKVRRGPRHSGTQGRQPGRAASCDQA